jgi:hypothetical protein
LPALKVVLNAKILLEHPELAEHYTGWRADQ